MRKIVVVEHLTLDGVMQAPGAPDEDLRGGFQHGGWAQPANDAVMGSEMGKGMGRAEMLFGRHTYERFYAFWPSQPEPNPFTEVLNKTQKYVASTTLTEPLPWVNSTLLAGDAAQAEPEVMGLLALMLLIESRRASRTTAEGDLVLLADQDRGRWDRGLIAEGQAIVRQCLRRNQPGPYQIQAAINAVHSDAATAAATDWRQILRLYDQLMAIAPSPVVALHRAVAVSEMDGPDAALALVDSLDLHHYHLFHAVRADLLRRLGRDAEAAEAYEAAIAGTRNATERDFLQRTRQALTRSNR